MTNLTARTLWEYRVFGIIPGELKTKIELESIGVAKMGVPTWRDWYISIIDPTLNLKVRDNGQFKIRKIVNQEDNYFEFTDIYTALCPLDENEFLHITDMLDLNISRNDYVIPVTMEKLLDLLGKFCLQLVETYKEVIKYQLTENIVAEISKVRFSSYVQRDTIAFESECLDELKVAVHKYGIELYRWDDPRNYIEAFQTYSIPDASVEREVKIKVNPLLIDVIMENFKKAKPSPLDHMRNHNFEQERAIIGLANDQSNNSTLVCRHRKTDHDYGMTFKYPLFDGRKESRIFLSEIDVGTDQFNKFLSCLNHLSIKSRFLSQKNISEQDKEYINRCFPKEFVVLGKFTVHSHRFDLAHSGEFINVACEVSFDRIEIKDKNVEFAEIEIEEKSDPESTRLIVEYLYTLAKSIDPDCDILPQSSNKTKRVLEFQP